MFGGGSYSTVYVPPPFCVFPMVLIMYIPTFFCHVLYAYFFFHICPQFFLLFELCVFVHAWMKTFGGVCAYASYAAIYVFGNMHA